MGIVVPVVDMAEEQYIPGRFEGVLVVPSRELLRVPVEAPDMDYKSDSIQREAAVTSLLNLSFQ